MSRGFLKEDLDINTWQDLKPYFDELLNTEFTSLDSYNKWLEDVSELEAVVSEDLGRRYIAMTVNTADKEASNKYLNFVQNIQPHMTPEFNKLEQKLVQSPYNKDISEAGFEIMLRKTKTSLDIYREENIPLQTKLSELSKKFGEISGAQSIDWQGETITMQAAAQHLKDPNEEIRKKAFEAISARRSEDTEELDELFEEMVQLRTQIAKNAGFENYRDYKLTAMNRLDYTTSDCKEFHTSVKKVVVPLVKTIQQKKLRKLGKDLFKPWDTAVDPEGKAPLKPFEGGKELLNKTVTIFDKLKPEFGEYLRTMNEMGHLDLESKPGKAPGGYNYPLYETGVPFIFMNAVGSQRDLVTMVHEGGHAIHSFLTRGLRLTSYKSLTSEIAELASMSMELLSMKYWNEFYSDTEELKRAKEEHLEDIIAIMPWISQVDEFQHWIYENYNSGIQARNDKWEELNNEYGTGLVDWNGYEKIKRHAWKRQLHIFEVPFYYIEYAISQLGALGIWKNSFNNEAQAIESYKQALSLGYTKSIPEVFQVGGTKMDFSETNLRDLCEFVANQTKEV